MLHKASIAGMTMDPASNNPIVFSVLVSEKISHPSAQSRSRLPDGTLMRQEARHAVRGPVRQPGPTRCPCRGRRSFIRQLYRL